MLVFYSVLVRQYAQYGHVPVYVGIPLTSCGNDQLIHFSNNRFINDIYEGTLDLAKYTKYGDLLKMLASNSALVRQHAYYGEVLFMLVFYSVSVRQYAQNGHVPMYVGILLGLSTDMFLCMLVFYLVLLRQYAQYGHVPMYVGILSTSCGNDQLINFSNNRFINDIYEATLDLA